MTLRRAAITVALATMIMALLTAPAAADTPKQAIKAFFAAMAKGDRAAMSKMVTGRISSTMPAQGSKRLKLMVIMGKAFKAIEKIKVSGQKTWTLVVLRGEVVAGFMMAEVKGRLAKIKDPKKRAAFKQAMKRHANEMTKKDARFRLGLVKKGGKWLISDIQYIPHRTKQTD